MIPFADFANHDGLSETIVLSDEDKELSEVIADCVYVPGDQVLISYGKFSNATLLLDFGFTLSHNIYDEAKIQVNIPHGDPLRTEKLKLLHKHRTPATVEGNSLCSSLDVFTIKEVRSIKGKGRGIPQALRAYCRVLCSTSSQELMDMANEAIDNDGRLARYPLKNKSREIEAHQFLVSWIVQLIEEYNESIELLETSSSLSMIEQHNRRRKMVLDLLTGELRVLKSAAEWLKNYCVKLSEC